MSAVKIFDLKTISLGFILCFEYHSPDTGLWIFSYKPCFDHAFVHLSGVKWMAYPTRFFGVAWSCNYCASNHASTTSPTIPKLSAEILSNVSWRVCQYG